ncbi:hypothetical protein LI291_08560 [Intestinibacillus massiliensis]|nr:hypothetical protein [Intestinibacillus massiliensis]
MRRSILFRKNIEPRCAYCAHAGPLDDERATCKRRGIVSMDDHCRCFKYDPLRRVPPKPAVLRGTFSADDFLLGDQDDEA